MNAEASKLRVALAVFEPPAAALRVFGPLIGAGIPIDRIGLILRASVGRAFSTVASTDSIDLACLLALLKASVTFFSSPDGDTFVASPRLLEPWRSGWRLPALWGDEAPGNAPPRLAPDLDRHVRSGAVIVAVESLSPREHWRCTRILLEQSSSSVLALECSLAPNADCTREGQRPD